MVEIDQSIAAKLALSCNVLANEGLSDLIFGHVSARYPGKEFMYMKPRGLGLEEVRPEDIIVLDFEGRKVAGEKANHSEYPIHTEVYKSRREVNCVVHTHPTYATALGATGGQVHPVSHEGVLFANLPLFGEITSLIRSDDVARALVCCLGNDRALLLRNHGIVVVGRTIEEATVFAVLLERAAQKEVLTKQFGAFTCTSDEESRLKAEQIYHRKNVVALWEYFVRKLRI